MLSVFMALLLLHAVYGYSVSAVAPLKSQPAAAVRPPAASEICMAEPHATIVFLRHGQSVWNEASLFTGWADVELTTLGKNEAAAGATAMWKEGIAIDVAFTSLLRRAQQTLDIVMRITGQEDVPVHQNWRLNERMCMPDAPPPAVSLVTSTNQDAPCPCPCVRADGALTGLNKKETVAKFGETQVKQWRRSYATPPPEIETDSEYWPGNDNKCAHIVATQRTRPSAYGVLAHDVRGQVRAHPDG